MIVRRGKRYILKSKESGRTLGTHPSRAAAERQETAINMSKARAAGHTLPPPPDERGETMRKIRSGKAKFLLPLVLAALVSSVQAATQTCPSGTLAPAGVTTTGPLTDVIIPRAAPALVVEAYSTAGTATVQVELSCDGSHWAPAGTAMSLTATGAQMVSFVQPACTFRANVTACSTCAVTVLYACAGP